MFDAAADECCYGEEFIDENGAIYQQYYGELADEDYEEDDEEDGEEEEDEDGDYSDDCG